ncbi:AAA family ATPase [Burkholderia cenocepacia]|uniref:AAA family ATPase n=1 Tax=Burkholderia cenocepacia TaxID=95486 RepID=UPI001B9B18F3|nr:AAA family ATPase [Burkholderia cenocepacia]MBR8403216.1 AAA family ATPase [Burkholderia cenocepacia]
MEATKFFTVLDGSARVPRNAKSRAFLYIDKWDDWGKYRTMFSLHIADENGEVHRIGSVKIGQKGLKASRQVSENHRAPVLSEEFEKLDDRYFSLGQDEDYYESLNRLSLDLRSRVLKGLRDCAFDLDIFRACRGEEVMYESLLRDVQESSVTGRLNRLARGDARLTKFEFTYRLARAARTSPAEMSFEVTPDAQPPTNVHVLIGRNGVGKTRCMRQLALTLLGRESDNGKSLGAIEMQAEDTGDDMAFAGLVLVSFSAFDEFELEPQQGDAMTCQQVGLRKAASVGGRSRAKSFDDLGIDFATSLERCQTSARAERWRTAVKTLEEDDLFAEADVTSLLDDEDDINLKSRARRLFKNLSSGHAIVLLTVTRLVELVDERTLVLLDEPEGHLHPPLLSSFVRCLSDLLVRRNGVGIVATHSPVVLQEVPRSCAWKLRRSGRTSVVERPTVETFGENIGVLTREVFGLQVTQSGFHQLLRDAVSDGASYRRVLAKFEGQLGDEAKAIVQGLIAERDEDIDA